MPDISIIIPVLNEARGIAACLSELHAWRAAGHEVIVVDGGSTDDTITRARPHADYLLQSSPGRALQMNHGAAHSHGRLLLFLHADTCLPGEALTHLGDIAKRGSQTWGRFDVALSGRQRGLRIVAAAMNLRSRLTGIATGDQAIFVTRELFNLVGGYRALPLMEDIEISGRLKRLQRPCCLHLKVTTSSRRWEQGGLLRTIVQMWWLRLCFFCGTDPGVLARRYRAIRERA